MKILFIQPTGDKRGHYGLWTSKLCQAIAENGHDLRLFTNKIYPEKFLDEPPKFNITELKKGRYHFDRYDQAMQNKSGLFWYGYFRNTYHIVKHALKLCRGEKFDAIFLTDVEYLTATLLLKRFKRHLPPVIWHVQAANFTYQTYGGSIIKKIYKLFQREIFKSTLKKEVKGFAVLGEYHKQKLTEQLKTGDGFPIEVIPDGADMKQDDLSQLAARKMINLDYSGTVFLFFGMLRKDKGIEGLIEAVSYLKDIDFKVIIAGAPFEWSAEELRTLVEQFQVNSKIDLRLGYIPDEEVSAYYCACDAVLFPYSDSYTGSCGPLTKGASTYAKPVIVTDVSDIGRMVRKYENGLIAEAGQAKSFAECMRQFMNSSASTRQVMAEKSAEIAQKHSWKNVATQLTNFIGKCHV